MSRLAPEFGRDFGVSRADRGGVLALGILNVT
jgi:hypothetical protein